jgi:hypothetical protein
MGPLRRDILDFLKPGSQLPSAEPGVLSGGIPADLEPSIRSLLSQGRKIDAVALLRSTRRIALADAMARVEQIERGMRTIT